MKKNQRIIDVVPLTKIPLTRDQFFYYLSEQEIPVGSLVSIPLFNRSVEGIVLNSRYDFERLGNIQLKKINKVLEENFLDKSQLELAKFISEYYVSPLGIVLKSFVPKRTKSRNKKQAEKSKKLVKNITLNTEQNKAIAEISKKINWKLEIGNWKFLLHGPSGSGKTEVYIHAIKNLKKNEQVLILLPELNDDI